MVFKSLENKLDIKSTIVRCACHTHSIEFQKITSIDGIDDYFLIIYREQFSLWYRVKNAFNLVFKGDKLRDEIILQKEEIKDIVKQLKDLE